jgi:hypothetical protein
MKNYIVLLSMFFAGFLVTRQLKADHVMGAEMSYKYLDSGRYKIIINYFRDCQGASSPPSWSLLRWYAGTNSGNSCGGSSTGFSGFTRTGIKDISPVCSTSKSLCIPANTDYTGEGIEMHTFECTIDLNLSPFKGVVGKSGCCELTIAYNQCCRSAAITTGAAWQDFWTTCTINVCNISTTKIEGNNSPVFTNPPNPYVPLYSAYFYNSGALDSMDYDSLSYKLVPGLQGVPGTSITYTSPFTYKYPLTPLCKPSGTSCTPNISATPPTGFYMDTASGNIIFTPTNYGEVGVLTFEVVEWRKDTSGKWVWVGKTRRDLQVNVKDDFGYNDAPSLSASNYNLSICEGDKICFDIQSKDAPSLPFQTVPDTLILDWNKSISGATFTVKNPTDREKTAQFCWQTKKGDARDAAYYFTATANDQHCPRPMTAMRSFRIKVKNAVVINTEATILNCGKLAVDAGIAKGISNGTCAWRLYDSTRTVLLGTANRELDTLEVKKGGKFIVELQATAPGYCTSVSIDTISFPDFKLPAISITNKDTYACYDGNAILHTNVVDGKTPYSYHWSNRHGHIPGDTMSSIILKDLYHDTTIWVSITDANGCVAHDTTLVHVHPFISSPRFKDKNICSYDSAIFDAKHADSMSYLWSSGETSRVISKNTTGTYSVIISSNTTGCKVYDTVFLKVNPKIITDKNIPKYRICDYGMAVLDAGHADTMNYLWSSGETSRTVTQSMAGVYTVKISEKTLGCFATDSILLEVNDKVIAHAGRDTAICNDQKASISGSHTDAAYRADYEWTDLNSGSSLGNNKTYVVQPTNPNPPGGQSKYYQYELVAKVTQNGVECNASDTVGIRVFALPGAQLSMSGNTISVNGNYVFTQYRWFKDLQLITGASGKTLTVSASGYYYAELTDSNGCVGYSSLMPFTSGVAKFQNAKDIFCWYDASGQSLVLRREPPRPGAEVVLVDMLGRPVLQFGLLLGETVQSLETLATGVYLVNVLEGNKVVFSQKILK